MVQSLWFNFPGVRPACSHTEEILEHQESVEKARSSISATYRLDPDRGSLRVFWFGRDKVVRPYGPPIAPRQWAPKMIHLM